ncbi:MAG TPA: hypothetical protein PKL06_12395 [Chitinophagales bacterium]|nr:hypothetical protein [Chitinophagales bacterium]
MKTTLTTKALTIIFFIGMISTYVAYSMGVFDPQKTKKSGGNPIPSKSLLANELFHPTDTPPANEAVQVHMDSEQFYIMMSSKTLFPAPQMSTLRADPKMLTLLADTNLSDVEKEVKMVEIYQQSNQQINAPPKTDSLHK